MRGPWSSRLSDRVMAWKFVLFGGMDTILPATEVAHDRFSHTVGVVRMVVSGSCSRSFLGISRMSYMVAQRSQMRARRKSIPILLTFFLSGSGPSGVWTEKWPFPPSNMTVA